METKMIVFGIVQAIFAVVGIGYLLTKFSGRRFSGTVLKTDDLTLIEKVKVFGPITAVFIGLMIVGFHASEALFSWLPDYAIHEDRSPIRRTFKLLAALVFSGSVISFADEVEELRALKLTRSAFIHKVLDAFDFKRKYNVSSTDFSETLERDLISQLSGDSDPYRESKGQIMYRQSLLRRVKGPDA